MIRHWIEVTDLDTGKVLNNSVCLSRKEAEDERQRLKDEDVTQQHRYGRSDSARIRRGKDENSNARLERTTCSGGVGGRVSNATEPEWDVNRQYR
jgi:hypothetical protein